VLCGHKRLHGKGTDGSKNVIELNSSSNVVKIDKYCLEQIEQRYEANKMRQSYTLTI
jgi:hypothetical protein